MQRLSFETTAIKDLVAPEMSNQHLNTNGGKPKWPLGLPVISAERFTDQPLRSTFLPRLDAENLHMKLGTNFEELTAEEAEKVLALPRAPVIAIYSSPVSSFAAHFMGFPKGPKPSPGERTLSSLSGPAVTYGFVLAGTALKTVAAELGINPSPALICKVGFSNSPDRRLEELNQYLSAKASLEWKAYREQWHHDGINAWAMEQEVFRELKSRRAVHIKGEMFAADEGTIHSAWTAARTNTRRPSAPILGTTDRAEAISD